MVGNILFSNGQTISGIVKDSSDDTPVAGVNIVMPSHYCPVKAGKSVFEIVET